MANPKHSIFSTKVLGSRLHSLNVTIPEVTLGYFLGPVMVLISNAVFGSYLNKYYTDIVGWTNTAQFGSLSVWLPLVSVIFIVGGNLIAGRLMDRIKTPQGKARPLLLLSAPLVALAIFLLLYVPLGNATLTLVWICISYNLYYAFSYPLYYASHSALVGLSTRNSKQRGLLSTCSNASGVAAVGFGANILVPIFFQAVLFVKDENGTIDVSASYRGWMILMIILIVLELLGVLLEYYFSRERISEESVRRDEEKAVSFSQQTHSVLTSKDWWILMIYFLLFQFGGLVKNASMTYFADWVLIEPLSGGEAMGLLGLLGGIPTGIGMILAWPLSNKLGKKNSIVGGLIISVLGGLVSFVDIHNFYWVCAGVVLKGIGSIPAMYVSLALLSDVLDHLEAKNGFRSDGFTMAVYGSIMVGLAPLSLAVINAFLTSTGYNAALSSQNDATQIAISWCFLGIELICYGVIAILLCFCHVEKDSSKDHELILQKQKEEAEAAGITWIEPAERLKQEEAECNFLIEKERQEKLRSRCKRKHLDYANEESKFEAKKAKRSSFFSKFGGSKK